jgi:hypothetical protein
MPHPEETFASLYKTDPQLKSLNVEKYGKLASDDAVAKTVAALEAKKFKAVVVNTKAEALEWLKKNIPQGKSIYNAHSTTLEEIGFVDYLKTAKEWNNLHSKVLAESDPSKQAQLYQEAMSADYFVCSATAVSQDGALTAADLTGTKTGGFAYTAGHLVLVCGTQKIVPTYEDAVKRTEEYALPIESARVRIAYKIPGSAINNFVALRGANPFNPNPRVTVVLVKDILGY